MGGQELVPGAGADGVSRRRQQNAVADHPGARYPNRAVINGAIGIITAADGKPVTVVGFTVTGAKITAIDLIDKPPQHR